MKFNSLLLCATSAASLFANVSYADEAISKETVIVTASRTKTPKSALPNTIEIINAKSLDVQSQIGGSLVDAVANIIPSFSPTRQKLSGAGETLRGRSPLYLIDSVPQSSPLRDDSRDGFTIDPFFINRVEVIYGSNAIQGIGATGGVVNYITIPSAKSEEWRGKIGLQLNADDSFEKDSSGYKFGAYAGRKFGEFDALIGGVFEKRGMYYDGENRLIALDGTQGDTMNSESYNLFGKFGFNISQNKRIELMLSHFELEGLGGYISVAGSRSLGKPASAAKGVVLGETPSNKVDTASLTFTNSDFFGGNLNAQLFYNDYSGVFGGGTFTDFQDPRISTSTIFDQSANNSTKKGLRLSYERQFTQINGLRALAGLDYINDETFQELIQTNRNWVPVTSFNSLSPFLQLNQALFDKKLNLSAGIRFEDAQIKTDDYETLYFYGARKVSGGKPSFSQSLYNYGATFEIINGMTAYASFAQGFTMPDVGRVLRAVTAINQDVDNFLDVSPVVSDNSEIGIDLNKGPVKASIAYFTSNSDKGALLVLKNDVFEVQRQKTEISGIEINFTWYTPIYGLSFNIGATELRGRTDTNGDGIVDSDLDGVNISPNRVNSSINYNKGPLSLRLQNQAYLKKDFYGIGYDKRNNFDGYSLMDLYFGYETKFGELSLSATNLLNKNYLTYNSDTRLPTNNLTYFAGRGRVLTIGYSKKF